MRVVISGGPGAGKTTLLHELHSRGYAVVEETARAVIKARLALGLPARPSPLEFAEEVLRRDIEQYHQANPIPTFFDRSILDALSMLVHAAPARREEVNALASRYPYHRLAFFLPPWKAIYVNDAERDQSFAEAVRVHESLVAWYRQCGYQIVQVPELTVTERCNFVLEALHDGDA
jgi:predicted ATPase